MRTSRQPRSRASRSAAAAERVADRLTETRVPPAAWPAPGSPLPRPGPRARAGRSAATARRARHPLAPASSRRGRPRCRRPGPVASLAQADHAEPASGTPVGQHLPQRRAGERSAAEVVHPGHGPLVRLLAARQPHEQDRLPAGTATRAPQRADGHEIGQIGQALPTWATWPKTTSAVDAARPGHLQRARTAAPRTHHGAAAADPRRPGPPATTGSIVTISARMGAIRHTSASGAEPAGQRNRRPA